MKVLVVEDDPLVAKDLQNKLELLGYSDLQHCESVQAARAIIEKWAPDVAILDVELKDGETGVDLGHLLDELNIPHFYVTGKQDLSTFAQTATTSGICNLEKPVSLINLRNALFQATRPQAAGADSLKKIISIPVRDGEIRVHTDAILCLKASRAYCEMYILDGNSIRRIVTGMALKNMLDRIKHPSIVRIHNSSAVNMQHVSERRGNQLFINHLREWCDIGKTYRETVLRAMN